MLRLKSVVNSYIIAPIGVGAYSVLLLYGENQTQVPFSDVWRLLLIVICGTILFAGALRMALPSGKAQFLSVVFLIIFFLFDPCARYIGKEHLWHWWNRYTIVEFACALIFCATLLLFYFLRKDFRRLVIFLNVATSILVTLQIVSIVRSETGDPVNRTLDASGSWIDGCKLPNIYYLILDAYGRADILNSNYRVDTTPFLDRLRSSGFYIAARARANYIQTLLSLSSSLNLNYLTNLIPNIAAQGRNRALLRHLIRESRVPQLLHRAKHKIIYIGTGFSGTVLGLADSTPNPGFDLNEFESFMFENSPIPALLKRYGLGLLREVQFKLHRRRVLFGLDAVKKSADEQSPHFVFAHILSPHPPFIFRENGEPFVHTGPFSFHDASHYLKSVQGTPARYIEDYGKQLRFLNDQVIEIVQTIVSKDPGAVVIIQGDHGPGAHLVWASLKKSNPPERLGILNAYRVPPEIRAQLYPEISPVNSFRLIFRHYCGAPLEKLEDLSYFSVWQRPFTFVPISDDAQ